MEHHVLIKGNRYGVVLVLDPDIDFEDLLIEIGVRFDDSAKYFNTNTQCAITFEGRVLSTEEIERILALIRKRTTLRIPYVIDNNPEAEERFLTIMNENPLPETNQNPEEQTEPQTHFVYDQKQEGMFYKGTLRSGQSVESKGSIVIIGDVNPGATVLSGGSIIVLGNLKGTAIAGNNGDDTACVIALTMDPIQIQIHDCIARSADKPVKKLHGKKQEMQIAYIEDGMICIDAYSKQMMESLNI